MYFLHPRLSGFYHSQLLHPSFAYMLAHPEERMKCHPKTTTSRRCHAANDSSRVFSRSRMHVLEEDDHFLLYTDLTGVKAKDLTVVSTNQGILRVHGHRIRADSEEPLKFDRQFLMDEKLIDSSKITASFSNGSLEIVAPKKQAAKPRRVAVVAGSAPLMTSDDEEAVRTFDVDVPGIKIDELEVEVDDEGKLVIAGERKRGSKTVTVHRTFTLDTNAVDTKKLETFLEDGVLTIRAPIKPPRVGRVIPVNATVQDTEDGQVKTEEKEAVTESPANQDSVEEVNEVQTDTKARKEEEKEPSELEFEVVPETVTEED